ncbi:MAG TPA: ATP-binding protein [Allosphingosinicella sp.]|nr:ATP-binding protein [Allosphingosinicella sp.]
MAQRLAPGAAAPAGSPGEAFGTLADRLPIICWQADGSGRPVAFNRRWDEYCGGDGDAAAHNAAILEDAVRSAGAAGSFAVTLALLGGDGASRPFLTHGRLALGAVGEAAGWVGTCTEVSEHVASERTHAFLLRLGDELRDESNPETILAMTSRAIGRELGADRVVYATIDWTEGLMHVRRDWRASGPPVPPSKYPMTNYSADHVERHSRGEPILSFDVAGDPELIDVMRERFLTVGVQAFASVPLVKKGILTAVMAAQQFAPRRWTEAEVQLLQEVAERTWATLERAEAAAALRESEQLFRTVTEAHPIPVVIAQESGIVLGNPAFWEMMGAPDGKAAAVDPRSWTAGGHGWEAFADFVRAHRRYDNYQTNMVRGGQRFPVAVSWRHIAYKGEPAVISSIVDLTESKRAEEELVRSREALHQAEKLTALGSLLAGVSHELNNPLTIVTAQASLLEELAAGSPMEARAEKVRRAAERCSKIVQTFLAMARQREPERSLVQAADVVRAALDLTEYSLRTAGIEVSLEVEPGLPPLHADPDQLHQVFVNLIVNAQQALQEKSGERRLWLRIASADGGRALAVEIEDNGPGVPLEIRRRVFEPFFTTKPEGAGTGVGLSFSLGLVEAHGGRLELVDVPGGGACFRVTLDSAAATEAPAEAAAPAPAPERRGSALVVDDEPDVAEVLEILATRAGYAVDVAANGREAIDRLMRSDYDVILSDLRMPQLDGPALFDWLEREKPHLTRRIAFVTGDTLGDSAARFIKRCGRPVLEKPFSGKNVRALLETLAASD